MTSQLKKAGYTAIVGLGLFAGAASISAAASGGSTPTPTPPAETVTPADNQANEAAAGAEADEAAADAGVNCEDGIDTATGAECDGGPGANQDNDPNEPADIEDADG